VVSHRGLILISLTTNDVDAFSCIYWPFACIVWRNVHSNPLPIFYWVVFSLLSSKRSLYTVNTSPLSVI